MEKHLKTLKETQDDEVIFKTKNPRKLAYYLRQAFRFIRNSGDLEWKNFDFSVKETTTSVICIRKVSDDISITSMVTDTGELVAEINTVEDVVGYCISNQDLKKIYFGDFTPNKSQLSLLQAWGGSCNIEFSLRNNKLLAQRKDA